MSRVVRRGVGLVLLLLLCLLLGSCDACKKGPRFYLIVGDPALDPETTYNVVFFGSGFRSKAELDFYRWAAHELAIHAANLFPHAGALQFWRVDLESDPVKENCPALCEHDPLNLSLPGGFGAPDPLGLYNQEGEELMDKELDVSVCRKTTAGTCVKRIHVGPRGAPRAHELAAYGPGIRTIVILANSDLNVGETHLDSCGAGVDRIVIGLPQPEGGEGLAAAARDLFAHEMGHALGLMDEYSRTVPFPPPYCADRNLWRPVDLVPCDGGWETAPVVDSWKPGDPVCPPIPWIQRLGVAGCDLRGLKHCCASEADAGSGDPNFSFGVTPTCTGVFAPAVERCVDFGLEPGECPYNTNTGEPKGLREGAHYEKKGIYRATGICKMSDNSNDFCPACQDYLEATLLSYLEMVEPRE